MSLTADETFVRNLSVHDYFDDNPPPPYPEFQLMQPMQHSTSAETELQSVIEKMDVSSDYNQNSKTWTMRPVQGWTTNDVTSWLCELASQYNISLDLSTLKQFSKHTGLDLSLLRQDEFFKLLPQAHGGDLFFSHLQHLLGCAGENRSDTEYTVTDLSNYSTSSHSYYVTTNEPTAIDVADLHRFPEPLYEVNGFGYDYDVTGFKEDEVEDSKSLASSCSNEDSGYYSSSSNLSPPYTTSSPPTFAALQAFPAHINDVTGSNSMYSFACATDSYHHTPTPPTCFYGNEPGANCSSSSDESDNGVLPPPHSNRQSGKQQGRSGRRKGSVSRSDNLLWKFCLELLRNPKYNEKIIRWEDRKEGVFRILQSCEVARLWGTHKSRKNDMNYEKLSRALRDRQNYGDLVKLPKGHPYPKKLCFKFGPRALGWDCEV